MRSAAYEPLGPGRLGRYQRAALIGFGGFALSCATAGTAWMNQPLSSGAWGDEPAPTAAAQASDPATQPPSHVRSQVIREQTESDSQVGADASSVSSISTSPSSVSPRARAPGGRVLGTFRNTYYDFPSESDFSGESVELKDAHCKTIKQVARGFYEAVCVQGSGLLSTGSTVSFAKRDCACAALCPRTEQHICFDELPAKTFPWGRGATGRAITPLLSIAVDSDLVPLDSAVYIPEYDGVPRDPTRSSLHDGCFIAQDRGVRVKGEHVDVFTGNRQVTALWNSLVPSNRGVTVIVDHPRCARASQSR